MSTVLVRPSSIEEEELAAKQAELTALQAELVDRECCLVNLRADLAAFEASFFREVGHIYAEIDEWKARTAELIASKAGTQDAKNAAGQAREAAKATKAAVDYEARKPVKRAPSAEMKMLYRDVARQVHPDYAVDEVDRLRRTRFMAEANRALEDDDQQALEAILTEFANGTASTYVVKLGSELLRVKANIEQVFSRLKMINHEIDTLDKSDIAKLMRSVQGISRDDLLARLSACAADDLRAAKKRHEEINQQVGTYVS